MKYALVKWINDNITGKLLTLQYKLEKERGDDHEALHCMAAAVNGNSEWCRDGACYLGGMTEVEYAAAIMDWGRHEN